MAHVCHKKKIVLPTEPAQLGMLIGAKRCADYIHTSKIATSDEETVLVI